MTQFQKLALMIGALIVVLLIALLAVMVLRPPAQAAIVAPVDMTSTAFAPTAEQIAAEMQGTQRAARQLTLTPSS